MNHPADSTAATPRERPGHAVKGPWVVVATLSLFLLVPALTAGIFFLAESGRAAEDAADDAPILWAERAGWPRSQYTTFKSLERGPMASARTNEKYKDLGFHVTAREQLAVHQAEALAKLPAETFYLPTTRATLESLLEEQPELFYVHHLLAVWHTHHTNPHQAEHHRTLAFRHAPAVIMRRYLGPDDKPLANAEVPPLALVADQIVNDQIDGSLVLVYPHRRTDAEGFVYAPTYKTILRETEPGLPAGVLVIPEKPQWFTFYGRFGRQPDTPAP
ncbi:MAG: hypothetical protein AAGG38_03970 [Planctomycetota bacterium]